MFKVTHFFYDVNGETNYAVIGREPTEELAKQLAERHYGTPEMTWTLENSGMLWSDEKEGGERLTDEQEYHINKV